MCLTIPAQVKNIKGERLVVLVKEKERLVKNAVLNNLKKNDWVLVNADLAIEKITPKEASELIELLN